MTYILGYPGSGTRWAARTLCGGKEDFAQEPFSRDKDGGLLAGYYPERMEQAQKTLARAIKGLPPGTRMVKEEFAVPYHMRLLREDDHRQAYIRRDTLGNVAFLKQWKALHNWMWYFEGLVHEGGEWASDLWPDDVPFDNVPCLLAVAHEVQLKHDLAAAKERGVPVFRYEHLCDNWEDEFGGLCDVLRLDYTSTIREYASQTHEAPVFPLDEQTTSWVQEITRRAGND